MLAHIPAGTQIVVEPLAPDAWARESGSVSPRIRKGYRWVKYPSLLSRISPDGALQPNAERPVGIEDYERTLSPALIGFYERHGYCWVMSTSAESGRAFVNPRALPDAVAYYRALERAGHVVFRASPYRRSSAPTRFSFDWTFDYYPLGYYRPGPEVVVYKLDGGACATRGPAVR